MGVYPNIRNIIFDLGGVLLNIDPGYTGEFLLSKGSRDMIEVHAELIANKLYDRFDSGKCSEAEFRDEIRKACRIKLTDDEVDEAWNALLLDFPAHRVKMLHELKQHYRVYLLSNTNSIHFRSYTKTFAETYGEDFPGLFDKLFLSYEMGDHKPDPVIYRKVIETVGLEPSETLFIDDTLANIEAAVEAGWIGYHLKNGMDVTSLFQNGKLRLATEFQSKSVL